ncbi:LysR substrate-binding domain-containing protein [Oligella urethralis]|uniref:LysR substrate-binding domain-containing protein n=1 Tax=Oligella urethralis TaxID=90245 RepID=UPI0003A32EDE|nr:LysR substrate-binding domain-containing protein [Oligella urethralis]SUA68501.1 Galactose-binding protein regulator [Oligella urethralis]
MRYSVTALAKRLRIIHLQILTEVYQQGSLLGASRVLHMSQPAISKVIRDLEDYFEQPLFIRTPQGVTPTDFTLLLLSHAQALQGNLKHLTDDLNTWQSGLSGRVTIGNMLTASASFVPRAVMRLKQLAPRVDVEIRVGTNDSLFPELLAGNLDLMLGILPTTPNPQLSKTILYQETLSIVAGRQNPLAADINQQNWMQDESIIWVIPPLNTAVGQRVREFFNSIDRELPKQKIESLSILTNLTILLESSAILVAPSSVVERFIRLGLMVELYQENFSLGNIGYSLPKDRPITPTTQRLIELLQTSIDSKNDELMS